MKSISRLGAILFASALVAGAGASTLGIGDKAPSIQVAKWIKGSPVTLGNGNINVVEFWATWCGPCKQSIPHLTELAKKYKGQVTFTGVSVWEERNPTDNSYLAKVESFVTEMGDKMDYNVAADGFEGTMAKTWMAAAGQNGIPTAFIVDKTGTIVWIGHPMGDLDKVLGQVIAGTWDAKAAAEAARKQQEKEQAAQQLFEPVNKAVQAKNYKQAAMELDKIMAANPEMAESLQAPKYNFLLMSDEKAAMDFARTLTDSKDAMLLNNVAWSIVDDKSTVKHPDYKLAVKLAERGVAVSGSKDAYLLDTLAYAYYKAGNVAKAIATGKKAAALAEAPGSKVPAETQKEIRDRLNMMMKHKGKG